MRPTEAGARSYCHFRRYKRGTLAAQILVPRRWLSVWLDLGGSFRAMLDLMMVPETAMVLASSIASVFLFRPLVETLSINLTWTAVSFMVVFPLQNAITSAYRRREAALQELAGFRALLLNVFLANSQWDWPGADSWNGRREDGRPQQEGGLGVKKKPCDVPLPSEHAERVRRLLLRAVDALQEVLLVPRTGNAREELACGWAEHREIRGAECQGREVVLRLLGRLHGATEAMKSAGMPANEASRVNQYNMMLVQAFERLWVYKTYRTPMALRAMMRVTIQLLPFFYGPYWLHVMAGDNAVVTTERVVFACFFSSLISLLMIVMINLADQTENPFRHGNRDTIRVKDEMELCRKAINVANADLDMVWHEHLKFEWEADSLAENGFLEA